MEVAGLPLHPLVVHAAVALTPLAVLFVVAYALLPRQRWLTRWPTAVVTGAALVSVWVSRLSGESLARSNPGLQQLVVNHERQAERLSLLMVGLAVAVAVGMWTLGGPSALTSGAGARQGRLPGGFDKVLQVVLVVAAAVVLVAVVLTGDSGTRAVWG